VWNELERREEMVAAGLGRKAVKWENKIKIFKQKQ
jgi:hypothetical protein